MTNRMTQRPTSDSSLVGTKIAHNGIEKIAAARAQWVIPLLLLLVMLLSACATSAAPAADEPTRPPATATLAPTVAASATPANAPTESSAASAPTEVGSASPLPGATDVPVQSQVAKDAAIVLERSGGFAGRIEAWAFYGDGRITTLDGQEVARVEPEVIEQLVARAEQADFWNMDAQYLPADPCCDRFTYALTMRHDERSHTVTTIEEAPAPDALWELIQQLNMLLVEGAVPPPASTEVSIQDTVQDDGSSDVDASAQGAATPAPQSTTIAVEGAPTPVPNVEMDPAVARARGDLAQRLNVAAESVQVISSTFEETQQGLACQEKVQGTEPPAAIVVQVIVLQSGRLQYQYRARGEQNVFCGEVPALVRP